MGLKILDIKAGQMVCTGCEDIIEAAVRVLPGVVAVKADYVSGKVSVAFDGVQVNPARIRQAIVDKGYVILDKQADAMGLVIKTLVFLLLLAFVGGLAFWGKSLMPGVMQQISPQMNDAIKENHDVSWRCCHHAISPVSW